MSCARCCCRILISFGIVAVVVIAVCAALVILNAYYAKQSPTSSNGLFTSSGNNTFSVLLNQANFAPLGAFEIDILVGSEKESFSVVLDTGSSDFWIVNKSLSIEYPGSSSTFVHISSAFTQTYVSGTVFGNKGKDSVCIDAYCWVQTFGFVRKFNFALGQNSGLMGLSRGCSDPSLCSLNHWDLNSSTLSFYYDSLSWDGVFTSGYADPAMFCLNSITYLPLISSSATDIYFWSALIDLNVNGVTLGKNLKAIFDTGTTYLYMNSNLYNEASTEVESAQCSDAQVGLVINGVLFNIPTPVLQGSNSATGRACGLQLFPFEASHSSPDYDILIGAVFLVNFYSVFDAANSRLGFCESKVGLAK